MTLQQVFDKVYAHLIAQNKQAYGAIPPEANRVVNETSCLYRTKDGLKCAAGCLINDEVYSSDLENKSAQHRDVVEALTKSGVPEEALPLIGALQSAHDDLPSQYLSSPAEYWKQKLPKVAERFGLICK